MPFLAQEHVPIPSHDLLSWMLDDPQYDVDEPIYIDAAEPSRSISYRQAVELIKRLSAGLRDVGLKDGDVVCLHAFNDIYYPILFLAIVAAGGIFAGTNPSYTVYELHHAIRTAEIRFFIAEPDLLPNVLEAASRTTLPRSNIFAFDIWDEPRSILELSPSNPSFAKDVQSFRTLLHCGYRDWERFDSAERCRTSVAARLFSSGTTGPPKALNMTHLNFIAQHTLVMEHRPRPYPIRRLICNPMFHVSQIPRVHTSPLRGGFKTFIMRRFDLEPWLRNVYKFRITEANLVPVMVVRFLNSGSDLITKKTFSSLRNAWSGAAPLDSLLQARFKKLLRDDAPFNQCWGMSETSCIATMYYYPEMDTTGGVGRMIPNHDAKIIDDDGNDISAYGTRGELCVRGPCIVPGYFKNEIQTRESWDDDGYFRTGDVAYCDERTHGWYIVDRKKELIKVRGFQVAPAELEGVLLDHPSIVDAAVIGIKDVATSSELPRAYIVAKPNSGLTETNVREYTTQRLARYKSLDGGVRFVEEIPKNASGKILKNQLRDMAKEESRSNRARL